MQSKKYYREDIQGLRAIAVLGVVLFHINPASLPGGYIGVDVFFVISGYLIMGFIWRDLLKGEFNLISFYTKRVKRLFPALFTMVIASSIAAYFILMPQETTGFFKSLISTLFYFSNFYFYAESNYFNSAMQFSPLLHTWSLSVEEQFYIFFPIILMLIYTRRKVHLFKILLALAIISLFLSEVLIYWDQSFSFFSSPTRFFQFIIGGLVSITLQKQIFSKTTNDYLSGVGLIIIILCMFLYSDTTSFPGLNALLPSFATALILFSGENSRYTNIFLSNPLFKLIGNSSYSLYLWHWPLIVFYKLEFNSNTNTFEQISLLIVSILFGYLSWKYIENTTKALHTERNLKPIYLSLGVSLLTISLTFVAFKNLPSRSLEKEALASKYQKYLNYSSSQFRAGKCFLTSKYNNIDFFDKTECIQYAQDKKNYLLIGESHAAHYYSALYENKKDDETISQITASGCYPILAYKGSKRCTDLVRWAYEDLIIKKHFHTIILSARWRNLDKKSLIQTINMLLKHTDNVVILGPTMEYQQPLPRLLMNLALDEDTKSIYKTAGKYQEISETDNLMKSGLTGPRVKYISVLNLLCDIDGCSTITPTGVPIAFDYGHFTHSGASYIIKQIETDIFSR